MKIFGIGLLAFVIWCVFSAWIYNDKLLPVLRKPVQVLTAPDNETRVADSLAQLKASMPRNLLIYFEFNETKFKPDPQIESDLAPFKAWLEKYPDSKLIITGHTDLIGTPEYNMELGLKRAQVVTDFVLSQGINSNRILTQSMGETRPIAGYITEENRAKNRRVEISINM